jgi:hypothetical protein
MEHTGNKTQKILAKPLSVKKIGANQGKRL